MVVGFCGVKSGLVGVGACVGARCLVVVCAPVGCWCCWLCGCVGVCAWLVSRFVVGSVFVGVFGESGCLGAGCVVAGGVLPVWLGDAVVSGGVGVLFDVGLRVFVLGGVSASACGSASVFGSSLVGLLASECGEGVVVLVGSVSSLAPLSDSTPASSCVSASSCGPVVAECGRVCVVRCACVW